MELFFVNLEEVWKGKKNLLLIYVHFFIAAPQSGIGKQNQGLTFVWSLTFVYNVCRFKLCYRQPFIFCQKLYIGASTLFSPEQCQSITASRYWSEKKWCATWRHQPRNISPTRSLLSLKQAFYNFLYSVQFRVTSLGEFSPNVLIGFWKFADLPHMVVLTFFLSIHM
jgi:hypothetical protein